MRAQRFAVVEEVIAGLSEEQLGRIRAHNAMVQQWVENPDWQHFGGEQFFQHEMPIDPSSKTRWRRRLGEAGAESMLLKETIQTGLRITLNSSVEP